MLGSATVCEWASERFELNRGGAAHNLRSMEGLRGLAVFLVFLSHYGVLMRPWVTDDPRLLKLIPGLMNLGGSGVDLFFLLSGFLIYGSLIRREQPFMPYFKRRLARLYPAFAVVFALYVALSFAKPELSKIPAGVLPGLGYLGLNFAMLPGIVPVEPMITVAWSLSYEIAYYLAIPAAIAVLGLRDWKPAGRVALFIGLFAIAIGAFGALGGPVRMITFLGGVLLYEHIARRPGQGPGSALALGALLVGLLSTQFETTDKLTYVLRVALLCALFYLACWASFGNPTGRFARALCTTPLRWLGNMSYSYYLIHSLAIHGALLGLGRVVPKEIQGPGFFFAFLPVMFAWTLVPSALLYLLVERRYSLQLKSR